MSRRFQARWFDHCQAAGDDIFQLAYVSPYITHLRIQTVSIETSEHGLAFLSQFDTIHERDASFLLSQFVTVSTSELRQWLSSRLDVHWSRAAPLALYAEREFPPFARFFSKLQPGPVRRAIGRNGPPLVKPARGSLHVGSEGIIAQLLTEHSRRDPRKFLLSPGPDSLRPTKTRPGIRTLAIVTDIIGSGTRITRMLDALYRTETFRSWQSHRSIRPKILIISYAATADGVDRVRSHRLEPEVEVSRFVPTVASVAHKAGLSPWELEALCERYDPASNEGRGHDDGGDLDDVMGPLGYGNAGTLLVFGYGCPNTTPRMFWKRKGRWNPLFPNRSAVSFEALFAKAGIIQFADALKSLGNTALSKPEILDRFSGEARQALLTLSAVEHGLHDVTTISARTGMDATAISYLLESFRNLGWMDDRNFISESGLAELRAAARVAPRIISVPDDPISVYFPESLQG